MIKRRRLVVFVVVALLAAAAWMGRGWLWRTLRELHGHGPRPHHADTP